MIKITIVIPCYNMAEYVTSAINSVLTYKNQDIIEIIVVNDGSDDNGDTRSVLDALDYPNLKVIHQNNAGLSNARNVGIKAATSDYVLLLDADNKIRAEYIDEGIKWLNNNPRVALVYSDLEKFGIKNTTSIPGQFDITKVLIKNYIDACVVLRKQAWLSVRGYDEKMKKGYEDWDFLLRLFFKGWEFEYVNKVLFDYRVRENSMLSASNLMREELVDYIFKKKELKQANKIRTSILEKNYLEVELQSIKNRRLISLALKIEKVLKKIFRS